MPELRRFVFSRDNRLFYQKLHGIDTKVFKMIKKTMELENEVEPLKTQVKVTFNCDQPCMFYS